MRWHRSDKTAMLDVIVDPVALLQPSFLYGTDRLRSDLRLLLSDAVGKAGTIGSEPQRMKGCLL